MSTDLFDGAYPDPPAPVVPDTSGLGKDAARTVRQKAMLEAGIHPVTRLPLRADGGTCGSCAFLWVKSNGNGYWFKCAQVAANHDGPDVRKWWPACAKFQEVSL